MSEIDKWQFACIIILLLIMMKLWWDNRKRIESLERRVRALRRLVSGEFDQELQNMRAGDDRSGED